jgi:hypothetical protein
VRFGKSDKIQFISTVEGLETIEECLPRPAKHFIPKWFKDIPSQIEDGITVKNCPSFPDYFSQGYILPMWCDTKLKYVQEVGGWSWENSSNAFRIDNHGNKQFLDYAKTSFNGIEGQFVFKAISPWKIITPPGWSVLQLPLFYHFNQEWSVLPGVIDTDIYHETNQQILYHGNGKETKINMGDPFVLYIPFKRSNNLKHEVKYQTIKESKKFNKISLIINQSFAPNGTYRKMQRKRDKKD